MKYSHTIYQKGFTAVELLITLFIAAIFLFAGYQLYTQVIKDGADAEKTARISNIVYEQLRKAVGTVTVSSTCPAGTTNETPTVAGFRSVTLTTAITCPFSTTPGAPDVSLVSVTASYNDGVSTKTMKHAIYAN